jgi:hypothetical protein
MSAPGYSWEKVPRWRVALFFLGVFSLFSIVGFINDIAEFGRQTTLRLTLGVVLSGGFAILYAVAGFRLRQRWWMGVLPIFVVQFVTINLIANWLPSPARPSQMGPAEIAQLQHRLGVNGVSILIAMVAGYICFLVFSIKEGRRYFRVHAEMELAAEIHGVLVPPLDAKLGGFEFCGRSQPSGEVGGDLIDLVQMDAERGWVAYIADVSGHGVAPGVVMGMVKSAARMQLTSGGGSATLLSRLNTVLHPLKKSEMFVTLAYLAGSEAGLEYSLAGHPPILHYHAASGDISELTCPNLPVAILEDSTFDTSKVECAPGDLFVLITDGLLEVENKAGEEFGMAGVKAALVQHAGWPLAEICQAIVEAAARYGKPADDQSLLLVKRLP